MTKPPESLRDMERRLNAGQAEAQRLLPALRELPADRLLQELEARPELCTIGMMECLLGVAADAPPPRAHELTAIILACAPRIALPPVDATTDGAVNAMVDATFHRRLQAAAWREHGRALHALGRPDEARLALARSRMLFECDPGSEWYVATVSLVEAPILHERGARAEALQLAHSAAIHFAVHEDYERYVDAGVLESSMLWTGGDRDAATGVWLDMAATARQRGDATLTARIAGKLAQFELGQGNVEEAVRLFSSVLAAFDAAGFTREAIQARRSLAEAAAARGRLHEAISELYKVHAELLANEAHAKDALTQAAVVSTDILDLLLATGRLGELARFTETLAGTFAGAGMPPHALAAFHHLRHSAARGTLDPDDIALTRGYFEDLPQHPTAPFTPPEEGATRA
jgi:tetratricopeptide (TPR) repeat protein